MAGPKLTSRPTDDQNDDEVHRPLGQGAAKGVGKDKAGQEVVVDPQHHDDQEGGYNVDL